MSRWLLIGEDEFGESKYKDIVIDEKECRYKVNGICFNNNIMEKLGKKCYKKCGGYVKDEKKDFT